MPDEVRGEIRFYTGGPEEVARMSASGEMRLAAPIGPLTPDRERWLRLLGWTVRVFVRGRDVTACCQYADDRVGRQCALFYRRNDQGELYLADDGRPAMELVDADVVIEVSRH